MTPFMKQAKARSEGIAKLAADKLALTADQQRRLQMILWGAFCEASASTEEAKTATPSVKDEEAGR